MSMATLHNQSGAAAYEPYPKKDGVIASVSGVGMAPNYVTQVCRVDRNNNTENASSSDAEERSWNRSPDYRDQIRGHQDESAFSERQSPAVLEVHSAHTPEVQEPNSETLYICEDRPEDERDVDEVIEVNDADRQEQSADQQEDEKEQNPSARNGDGHPPVEKSENPPFQCRLAGDKTVIGLSGFSHYFAHNLYTLHHRQQFCDVTIRASDRVIQAHKVVLAACSPYFYNVLQRKQSSPDVKNPNNDLSTHSYIDLGSSVSGAGLAAVVDCMYSSRVAVDRTTVHEVLQAATALSMHLVAEACIKFLQTPDHNISRRHNENVEHVAKCESEEKSCHPVNLSGSCGRSHSSSSLKEDEVKPPASQGEATSNRCYPSSGDENPIPDPENSAIYQSISPQDVTPSRSRINYRNFNYRVPVPDVNSSKSSSPKSINWKKYKYITQNQETPPEESQTQAFCKSESPTSPGGDGAAPFLPANGARFTDADDDDVFVKKATPREPKLSGDPMASTFRKLPPDHHNKAERINSFAADLIRRHQRDAYSHAMSGSPYMLTPETMAAAMAMSSLTSIRSPANSHFLTGNRREHHPVMAPWHHILSQRYSQLQADALQRHSPTVSNQPLDAHKLQSHLLHEQKLRQQAMLFSGMRPFQNAAFNTHRPEERSCESDTEKSLVYNPSILKNLLRRTSSDAPSHPMKRSFSTESNGGVAGNTPAKRFSGEKTFFRNAPEHLGFSNSLMKPESPFQPSKQRRSTTSTSSGSPDRPYKCLVCAAEFNRPANLKTHMRIHSGEKPYKCQSCGARFVQVAHLRAHILIHTGEKPYPCKVCGTRFRHLQTLKSHLRIHTGEKPYACDECNVRFRHKSQLRLHLRTKHGINTNTKKTYQQVPGLRSADISAHIKRTQEAVRMQAANKKEM